MGVRAASQRLCPLLYLAAFLHSSARVPVQRPSAPAAACSCSCLRTPWRVCARQHCYSSICAALANSWLLANLLSCSLVPPPEKRGNKSQDYSCLHLYFSVQQWQILTDPDTRHLAKLNLVLRQAASVQPVSAPARLSRPCSYS